MEQIQKRKDSREVRQIKMELAAAHERGETALLRQVAQRYPAHVEMLADFIAGLYATDLSGQEAEMPLAAELEALTLRARQRALLAVFGLTPATQTVGALVHSLAQARKACGLSLVDLARRLALGADVVQKLEQGRIAVASVPQKLADRLAEALTMSSEQVWNLLRATPGTQAQPALLRRRMTGRPAQQNDQPVEQTFAEAVLHSPSMTAEQRALWLEEGA